MKKQLKRFGKLWRQETGPKQAVDILILLFVTSYICLIGTVGYLTTDFFDSWTSTVGAMLVCFMLGVSLGARITAIMVHQRTRGAIRQEVERTIREQLGDKVIHGFLMDPEAEVQHTFRVFTDDDDDDAPTGTRH